MDRKRTWNKPKPILMGEGEVGYMKAVEIARACDNLPPLIEDFKEKENE